MQKDTENWFASWFDSPYYHILYKDRNDQEAGAFMTHLTSFLKLATDAEILDLACGKGRHSRFLSNLGYQVTGVDLSPQSIAFAKQFENENLKFEEHDMSLPYPKKFDAVFNLFTSFGYFEREEDNLKTIKAIKTELKDNGFGVIDFLNAESVKQTLVPSETKIVDGITFQIRRKIENGFILKNIRFNHNNQDYNFTERVKAISLSDFKTCFKAAGVQLIHCFGDYQLNEFNETTSNRLILIFN
ncbi:MAG: class I SAM-dependent methyltransferase [Flavobacteriaceae bacterium]|nr:class I SAM-dependent methyltransferase [Flavobacteriaceae bacterium]